MHQKQTQIERAFELACSGGYSSVNELRDQLSREGFVTAQIVGPSLLKQLRLLMATAAQGV